ncbi:hypothetical protein BH23BAC1_BH23BAC1_05730 [soil metagenome]
MQITNNEVGLLICCLKNGLNSNLDNDLQLKDSLNKEINWDNFLSITSVNRVIPLVWISLKEHRNRLPQAVSNSLQDAYFKIAAHHTQHISDLTKLLLLFKENNLEIFPIKGAVLGQFYKYTPLREWSDLDIIIKKNDINKVTQLLNSNSYFHIFKNISFEEALKSYHSINFAREDYEIHIDVHWRLADVKDELDFKEEIMWRNYSNQFFYGVDVPMLNLEYLVLSCCIHHGLRNGWNELRFVCDLAAILKSQKQIHWVDILNTAEQIEIKRILLVGIFLSQKIFDMPLPYIIKREIGKDKKIHIIASKIFKKLFNKNKGLKNSISNKYFQESLKISMRDNRETKKLLYKNFYKTFFIDYLNFLVRPLILLKKEGINYLLRKLKEKLKIKNLHLGI